MLRFSEEGNQITNMLLCCYSKYNHKLKQLALLFKYLAQVSQSYSRDVIGAPKIALRAFFDQGSNSSSLKIIANLFLYVPY